MTNHIADLNRVAEALQQTTGVLDEMGPAFEQAKTAVAVGDDAGRIAAKTVFWRVNSQTIPLITRALSVPPSSLAEKRPLFYAVKEGVDQLLNTSYTWKENLKEVGTSKRIAEGASHFQEMKTSLSAHVAELSAEVQKLLEAFRNFELSRAARAAAPILEAAPAKAPHWTVALLKRLLRV